MRYMLCFWFLIFYACGDMTNPTREQNIEVSPASPSMPQGVDIMRNGAGVQNVELPPDENPNNSAWSGGDDLVVWWDFEFGSQPGVDRSGNGRHGGFGTAGVSFVASGGRDNSRAVRLESEASDDPVLFGGFYNLDDTGPDYTIVMFMKDLGGSTQESAYVEIRSSDIFTNKIGDFEEEKVNFEVWGGMYVTAIPNPVNRTFPTTMGGKLVSTYGDADNITGIPVDDESTTVSYQSLNVNPNVRFNGVTVFSIWDNSSKTITVSYNSVGNTLQRDSKTGSENILSNTITGSEQSIIIQVSGSDWIFDDVAVFNTVLSSNECDFILQNGLTEFLMGP